MFDERDGDSETAEGPLRRLNRFAYLYYGAIIIATLSLSQMFGVLRGSGLVLCGHVLLHVPIFKLRSEGAMRTEKATEIVHDEFASVRNPLTSLWLATADQLDDPENGSENSVLFTVSGLRGLLSSQYSIHVEDSADSSYRVEIRQDGSVIIDTHLTVESVDDGTRLQIVTERTAVHAYRLLSMILMRSEFTRYFASYGYEPIEENLSVRLRPPSKKFPFTR